uniref:Ig-like domain-containing protein n=1 Tax=Terrapene triunguis TaxID=2587831 RepID=A0A674JKW9_9SAUR
KQPLPTPQPWADYSLKVPQLVSVQEGLCVLVPCSFTYPASFDTDNPSAQLFRNWYKDQVDVHWDLPVASSDPSRGVSQETQSRFQLTGDLTHGNCSLQISDAQRMDAGRYFLRVEKGDFKYSYRSNYYHTHPTLQILQPEFTLMVPQSVSVQEGLCVLVPCTFTYPASYDTYGSWARLFRYWYKDTAFVGQNPPVASSNPSQRVSQQTKGRFRLAENPVRGDCSLQISDAQRTDAGRYFLRVEGDFSYNYRTRTDGTDLTLTISVPGTLLAGEPVTVTCTAPGRCSGTPPQITWTRPFSNTAQDVSTRLAKGTSAHSSVLRFTPTPGDDGKELVCTVTYRPRWEPSTRRTVQLRGLSHPPAELTLEVLGAEGDIVSLVTQEGDSLTLRCEAGSRTEVTLSWARVNGSLSPSQGGAGYLELLNLSPGDVGDYRCWAKNSYGWASRALRVHVQCKALGGAMADRGSSVSVLGCRGYRWGVGSGAWDLFPLGGIDPDPVPGQGLAGSGYEWLCYSCSQIPAPWSPTVHSSLPRRGTPCGSSAPSPAAPPQVPALQGRIICGWSCPT